MAFSSSFIVTTFLLLIAGLLEAIAQKTGDSYCAKQFCVTGSYDPTAQLTTYTITSTSGTIPWASVGLGDVMAGNTMYVTWPGASGDVMFSERVTASGHSAPKPVPSPKSSLLTTASLSNTSTFISSWTVPQNSTPPTDQIYMWAVGNVQPNPDDSAPVKMHSDFGTFKMDLTKPISAAAGSGSGSKSSGKGVDKTKIIIAHGVVMAFAWGLFTPVAILVGRFGRGIFPKWVLKHQILQSGFTFVCTIVGFILAMVFVGNRQGFTNYHEITGLVVVCLMIVQLGFGGWIHHFYNPDRKRRPWTNWAHIILGVILLVLGLMTIQSGYALYGQYHDLPGWVNISFIVWCVMLGIAFVGGAALLPRQVKEERERVSKRNVRSRNIRMVSQDLNNLPNSFTNFSPSSSTGKGMQELKIDHLSHGQPFEVPLPQPQYAFSSPHASLSSPSRATGFEPPVSPRGAEDTFKYRSRRNDIY